LAGKGDVLTKAAGTGLGELGNAVFHATGKRIRQPSIRIEKLL